MTSLPNPLEPRELFSFAPAARRFILAVAILAFAGRAAAQSAKPRAGKVLLIRGAFTVFSLGLDSLGVKLEQAGLDVSVVPALTAGLSTSDIAKQYKQNPEGTPIVLIGHSKGGQLAPDCARQLDRLGIPVKLIVIVDNVHRTTIPGNVEKCVNFYHTNSFGLLHGLPVRGESRKSEVLNVDIGKLPERQGQGYIDHFNIDGHGWVHELVIEEVLKVCPPLSDGGRPYASTPRDARDLGVTGRLPSRAERKPESGATGGSPTRAQRAGSHRFEAEAEFAQAPPKPPVPGKLSSKRPEHAALLLDR